MTRYKIIYNNTGGAAADIPIISKDDFDNQPFYLFTTGIVNWANFNSDDQNLIEIWNRNLRNFIISKIPNNFYIILNHYDPLFDADLSPMKGREKEDVIKYIQQNLIPNDNLHPRIIESQFSPNRIDPYWIQGFDFPHLILDFAHIFVHPPIQNHVTIGGHYGEDKSKLIKLNVLRTGFIGNGFGKDFTLTDNIRIKPNGQIETYINKLIELEIEYDPVNPSDFIGSILNQVIASFERKLKKLKADKNGNLPLFYQIEHIYNKLTPNKIDLINSIMLRFWDNMSIDKIINEVSDYYISQNIDRILEMNPLPLR